MRSAWHLAIAVLAGVLGVAGVPRRAAAHAAGEIGHSGKQGAICNECHSGGMAPTVSFDGPATVVAGAIVTYRFTVVSARPAQRAAGFNVAATAGALATMPGAGEQLISRELTHTAPQNDVDGAASWEFAWTAPDAPGAATLFGAGNSVNRNSQSTGDRAAAATLSVMVVEAETPTPTATLAPPPTDTAVPANTPAPTRPSDPTMTPGGPCRGDCDGNGVVAVNELVLGVSVALGSAATTACAAVDANGDGQVAISELIAAVAGLLDGCP